MTQHTPGQYGIQPESNAPIEGIPGGDAPSVQRTTSESIGTTPYYGSPYGAMPPAPGAAPAYHPAYGAYYPQAVGQPRVGDAWKWSWAHVKARPLMLAAFPLIVLLPALVFAIPSATLDSILYSMNSSNQDVVWPHVIMAICGILCMFYLILGAFHFFLNIARGQDARLKDLFVAPNALHGMIAMVVTGVITYVGSVFLVFGLIAQYFFLLTGIIAVDQRCHAFAAIKRSCSLMAKGGNNIVFFLTFIAMAYAGLLTAVGWIILAPMGVLMTAYLYLRLSGQEVAPTGGQR